MGFFKNLFKGNAKQDNSSNNLTVEEELVKYQELLETGIMTQAEYDAKKKELIEKRSK